MSQEGKNEIFKRSEVLQEIPSSIVLDEDSQGQGSMDSFAPSTSPTKKSYSVRRSLLKVRAIIMKKIKVLILHLQQQEHHPFRKSLGD